MLNRLARLARPFFLSIDPERAHDLAIESLRAGIYPRARSRHDPALAVELWDLHFPNPIGMAAGFDKSAEVPDALLGMGLGFCEVGSITPRPQSGNPKPRVFRSEADRAVINRLGFNNKGHRAARRNLLDRRTRTGVVGINIGANKDSEDRAADYVAGIEALADLASFFTVNVSSPNTPGLRDLQGQTALDDLMARVLDARDRAGEAHGRRVPVLLKIAPDVTEADLDSFAAVFADRKPDGLVATNTTLSRAGLADPGVAAEAGGLSGAPLFDRATIVLAKMRQRLDPAVPIIGVGGIGSGADAYAKIKAGASLVELYTGLIYGGFELVGDMLHELSRAVAADGHARIADAVGTATADWAGRSLEQDL